MRLNCMKCQTARYLELKDILPSDDIPSEVVLIYHCKLCGMLTRLYKSIYETCPNHPRYTARRPPKNDCHDCWHIWFKMHGDIL